MGVDVEKWERRWRERVPRPVIATHTTLNEKAIKILETQRLTAEVGADGVSMSMDQHLWGEPPMNSIFVFDLKGLMREVTIIPSFYFLPEMLTSQYSPSKNFRVDGWPMVLWAEINSLQDVSLKNLRYLVSWSPEVRKRADAKKIPVEATVESTNFSRFIHGWRKVVASCVKTQWHKKTVTPCNEKIEGFLSSYNAMVADLFNLNLNDAQAVAKDYCIRWKHPIWWEK